MQNLSINSNQGSQAYGNEAGGNVVPGAIVKATVVEKLSENLYLLQIGRHTIEAQIVAELDEGTEYQFVVQKGGQPPELALLQESAQQKDPNGLSPEENRWVGKLANAMGLAESEFDAKSLISWVRVLGFDINSSVEQVYQQLKPVLELMPAIDSAPPAIRQLMGHTLLFTMHQQQQTMGDQWFDQAIRLSGQIPKWSESETKWLLELKSVIESMPKSEQAQLKTELLNLKRPQSSQSILSRSSPSSSLPNLVAQITGREPPENVEAHRQNIIKLIQDDPTKRLFLASQDPKSQFGRTIGSLQRSEAIASFQRQAPGLMTSDISNLLEQFTSLGGQLEKLKVGDVVSAQLAWKGATPSAMDCLLYTSDAADE